MTSVVLVRKVQLQRQIGANFDCGEHRQTRKPERINMAAILLNESDPIRHAFLRSRLQRHGHSVWSAHHLNDIIATLHDVAIDLMILISKIQSAKIKAQNSKEALGFEF
jgi:hypothetical protein